MRKKILYPFIPAILLLSVSAKIDPIEEDKNPVEKRMSFDCLLEIEKMQSEFKKNVDSMTLEEDYLKFIMADAREIILNIDGSKESQFFVYADRNLARQIALVCFFDSAAGKIAIIGADKISTGNPERKGYFPTPTGVFENRVENPSYRALGTKNQKGWMGLGVKNSRVWDFGWQETVKNDQKFEIRLLMHATDPVFGEKKLGEVDSKGCVRISARLNEFLDHYGILDKNYEENKHLRKVSWLLAADREPTVLAGKYLLIGDSGNSEYCPEDADNQGETAINE